MPRTMSDPPLSRVIARHVMKRASPGPARFPRGFRSGDASPSGVRAVPLVGGLLVLAGMVGYLGFDSLRDREASKTSYNPVDDLAHIHALGFQADDPHKLLVATHEGLIRGFHDRDWSRVGIGKDNIMGFAAHPAEALTLYASGHEGRDALGIQRSTDGGFTWQNVGLDGKDLHAIAISRANPEYLWAFDGATLHASVDAGATWSPIRRLTPEILSLAPDATRAATLYAATPEGLQRSDDAGLGWDVVSERVLTSIASHPRANATLIGGASTGVVLTRDGGLTWEETGLVADAPITNVAIDPETPTTFYAATARGAIYKTETSGATWEQVRSG